MWLSQLSTRLSKFWRKYFSIFLRKKITKWDNCDYIDAQLFILRPQDLVSLFSQLNADIKFPARTDNIEDWSKELFNINHAYSKGDSVRSYVQSNRQHNVSARLYLTDSTGNYVDGNSIMPAIFNEIKALVENYKKAAAGTSSRDINTAFILEHYLNNVRETLDAWLHATYE